MRRRILNKLSRWLRGPYVASRSDLGREAVGILFRGHERAVLRKMIGAMRREVSFVVLCMVW